MPQRLRSAALVGRAQEVALLDRLLEDAARGRGAVVVVRGEPGVGKSRLLSEQVDRARASGRPALVGRAVEGGGAFRPLADALLSHQRRAGLPPASTLGPFAGALGRLVPGWSAQQENPPGADLPLLVSEGLLRLLRVLAGDRGLLLALDDLHWADADTMTALERLAAAVADLPALVLLVARQGQHPALDRLATGAEAQELRLGRLAPSEAAALASSCADEVALPAQVREHVVEHAEGLPFLVEELLRGLVESGALVRTAAGWEAPDQVHAPVPVSFATVVQSRMQGLDEQGRQVVEAAAVLGRTVDWRLLVSLTQQSEAAVLGALRHAVDRGLLVHGDRDEPDVVRFVHALTREAVLERLLPPQRQAIARTAARVVETDGPPVLAATLHAEAGQPAKAARLLLKAAEAEGAALRTREALLRQAAALAPDDLEVAHALVQVLALAGRAVEARELGDPLLARTPADDPRRPTLALTLARTCVIALHPDGAERYLSQAGNRAQARALAGEVALLRHRTSEAESLALSVTEEEDPRARCEALELLGRIARLRDRRTEAEAAFGSALDVAERHRLPLHRVRALAELGTLDMLGPARPVRLQQARELAVHSGQLWTAAILDRQLMACHNLRMEHPETLEVARRGVELAESLRLSVLAAGNLLFVARAQGHLGQVAEMQATIEAAEPRLRDAPEQLALLPAVRATPALVQHDLPTLFAALQECERMLSRTDASSPSPYRGMWALLETVLDDGAAAREELRSSGGTVQSSNRGALAYADAVAAARAGADPTPHLQLAERELEPLTWRRHHCRLLVAPAAVRDGWGQPLEWLREGAAYFEQFGDAALARACREQLRRAGAPVPRRTGGTVVPVHLRRLGVTGREAEVLALVVQGLTSAAIAERLVLSPRTVETHVANLLAKTGAASRGELADYVTERR
jgi:DNA-binding CsgD family transcriptional regulator